jgi:hypothetical protein
MAKTLTLSKKDMQKREAKETRASEKRESPAYQKREKKMGVEKHGGKRGAW